MAEDIKQQFEEAHKHSMNHRNEIHASEICGCFYCLAIFTPGEIEEWIDFDENGVGQTAVCPECSVDAVIGSKSGFPITEEFLEEMRDSCF